VLYCTALQCTIMYCNALYYTVLDCTVTCAGIAAARSCGRWCASSKTTRGLPGAAFTCCPGPRTTRLWATCSASCSLRITTGWVLVKAEWCQLSGFVLCFPVQADLACADEHFCCMCQLFHEDYDRLRPCYCCMCLCLAIQWQLNTLLAGDASIISRRVDGVPVSSDNNQQCTHASPLHANMLTLPLIMCLCYSTTVIVCSCWLLPVFCCFWWCPGRSCLQLQACGPADEAVGRAPGEHVEGRQLNSAIRCLLVLVAGWEIRGRGHKFNLCTICLSLTGSKLPPCFGLCRLLLCGDHVGVLLVCYRASWRTLSGH
jgi:hypothetical protein